MLTPAQEPSFLATRRGKLTLVLLCGIAFLDFVDGSITNVALPSIRRSLHFSVDGLQWIPSGYLLTYGGFMLLGGRLADLRAPGRPARAPPRPRERHRADRGLVAHRGLRVELGRPRERAARAGPRRR